MPADRKTAVDRSRMAGSKEPSPSASLNCPECGKLLDEEPNFCPSCGSDLRGLSGDSDTLDGSIKERLIDRRYRVLEKLGEGGMGAVYKVEHVRMGKLAALKLLRPDHALDKALKARFLQEARVVAKLSHPNTVQVFDSGELDDGGLFIAMEFVPGKDLAWQLKAHGPMAEAQAANIGAQLLASLQEAHEAGIIHRDIKPANVMLARRRKSGEEQVKLLDFGIAKLQEAEGRKSTTGDFIGTPAYMSPEQIRGDALDPRSDLYSMGCLLFELVSGRQPFEGPNSISVLTQHYEAPVPRVTQVRADAQVSPGFQAVLDRAMAKRAADRFPDADAMRVALEQLNSDLGKKPSEFTPMPVELSDKMLSREAFDQFERQLRLRRTLAPVIALLLLALAALAGLRLLRNASEEVMSSSEVEPNDQASQATRIALGVPVRGTIGASANGSDRDLFVATVAAQPHRLTLTGVADLNLTVEVLQLERREKEGVTREKLVRKVLIDDLGSGQGERVDGLHLAAGELYLRVEEQAFCDEPNRPSRERSLVPYTIMLEPLSTENVAETEPNDTPLTAQTIPLTRAVAAWGGHQVDLDALAPLRPDGPFSAADWFRVEAPTTAGVVVAVAVVPPERGALMVVDGAALEAFAKKTSKSLTALTVKGGPQWVELKPMADGQYRLRVLPGEELLPGAEFLLAAATSGENGLAAVIDLGRVLDSRSRSESRRQLMDATRQRFPHSADLSRLNEN